MKKEKRVLALYLIFVLAISAIIETLWISIGEAAAGLSAALMLVPAIVAIILKVIYFRKQNLLGLRLGKAIYYLFAVIVPLIYIGLSYFLYWKLVPGTYLGADAFNEALPFETSVQSLPVIIIISFIVMFLINIPVTFGEELGWRGFMYPIMDKLWGRNYALFISGGIWAIWHLPLIIGGVYMTGAAIFYQVPMFIILVLSVSVIASWLRMKSGSVWPAILWHSVHNVLDQAIFTPMTGGANKAYFVSETGFITTICAAFLAVLILVFYKFKTADEVIQERI